MNSARHLRWIRRIGLMGHIGAVVFAWALYGNAVAALPAPTAEEAQAAAAKKAAADAQTEKDKQSLAASMDAVAAHWRSRAAAKGWTMHQPTQVQAAQGFDASATQSSSSGQPGGKPGAAALQAPIRSEKSGTSPPSPDVKQAVKPPTQPDVKANAPDRAN